MSKAQIKRLLGPADDTVNEGECQAVGYEAREAWAYGTDGHLGYPTWGVVLFKYGGSVEVAANELKIPVMRDGVVPEHDLRRILRLLSEGTSTPSDPLRVIRIYNAILPLGARRAAAILREYVRLSGSFSDSDFSIYNSYRLAFNIPQSALPDSAKYSYVAGEGVKADPVVLVDDIPISLAPIQTSLKMYKVLLDLAQACEKSGTPSASLLRPTNDVLSTVDKVRKTRWYSQIPRDHLDEKGGEGRLAAQMLLIVRTAVVPTPSFLRMPMNYFISDDAPLRWWGMAERKLMLNPVRWDVPAQCYLPLNGPGVDIAPQLRWRVWKVPAMADANFRVVASRKDGDTIVTARWDAAVTPMKVRLFDAATRKLLVPEFEVYDSSAEYSAVSAEATRGKRWYQIILDFFEPTRLVRVEVVLNRRVIASPVLDLR
jgi:hypothetical protein